MKQKIQAVDEILCEITNHLDAMRESAFDLTDLGISPAGLTAGITVISHWQSIAGASNPLIGIRRLIDPTPRNEVIREDPPCIACGAPESVCECGTFKTVRQAAMPVPEQQEMVSATAAYDNYDGTMACCNVEAEMFQPADPEDLEPEHRCPKCKRICLGEHPDASEARSAENKAGWDATP